MPSHQLHICYLRPPAPRLVLDKEFIVESSMPWLRLLPEMFLQNGVCDGNGRWGRRRVEGSLYRVYGLLLEYVAGEEEEGREYEDCGGC